jgi:hypothetical protein
MISSSYLKFFNSVKNIPLAGEQKFLFTFLRRPGVPPTNNPYQATMQEGERMSFTAGKTPGGQG